MTEEYTERIFGSSECAVLYLNADLMKTAKLRPGNRVKIIPDAFGFKVQLEGSHAGQPARVEARNDRSDVSLHDEKAERPL